MKRDQRLIAIAVYVVSCCLSVAEAHALGGPRYVTSTPTAGNFALVQNGATAPLLVSASDWPGVIRAAGDLSEDVKRVTDQQPAVLQDAAAVRGRDVILIGTIGKSILIDDLIRRHKLDVTGVAGKWESAVTTIVDQPMPGSQASARHCRQRQARHDLRHLRSFGADRSLAMVLVGRCACAAPGALYVQPGRHVLEEPAVKYRGIFLNDEAPSLTGWVNEKFGGYNSKFYVHVFELLLRLKANYLWPAMWNSAFNEDDPREPKTG